MDGLDGTQKDIIHSLAMDELRKVLPFSPTDSPENDDQQLLYIDHLAKIITSIENSQATTGRKFSEVENLVIAAIGG